MKEIQVAVVAIAVVLSAVVLPMAFFGGSTGVICQQFSLTIISCMVLSVLVALILSPALTATLLKARKTPEEERAQRQDARAWQRWRHAFSDRFNRTFARGVERYSGAVGMMVDRKWLFLAVYGIICAILIVMFQRCRPASCRRRTRARPASSSPCPPAPPSSGRWRCSARSSNI